MTDLPHVTIYTDGAAIPNPGKAGWAAVLLYGPNAMKELSGPIPHATNNVAELTAAIEGLRALKRPCLVTIISDSQWLVNCGNGQWQRKANTDLWEALNSVVRDGGHMVRFEWVRGHNGDRWNERADYLANRQCEVA